MPSADDLAIAASRAVILDLVRAWAVTRLRNDCGGHAGPQRDLRS